MGAVATTYFSSCGEVSQLVKNFFHSVPKKQIVTTSSSSSRPSVRMGEPLYPHCYNLMPLFPVILAL